MKIWVTGIGGFLGSHLAEALLAAGHQVMGNDNLSGGDISNVPVGAKMVLTDCRHQEQMAFHLREFQPDILYHCAAMAHEGLSSFSPAFIFDNVAQASVATFSAAIASGCKKIVFLSSMARYGKGEFSPPFGEHCRPLPVDPYGVAKVAAEQVLQILCQTHGVRYQIAVPHNIIGPRQCYTDPHRNVASIFLNRLKQGKPGIIYGTGSQQRCFSPVQDIVPCLVKLGLDDSLGNGEVWNLGPDRTEIPINMLYQMCSEAVNKWLPAVTEPARPNEVAQAYCTADKAREKLGFTSNISVMECLSQMAAMIPKGGRPFQYDGHPLEIEQGAPRAWRERLI